MALREGHRVYLAVFDLNPVDGQTVSAVVETIARFIARIPAAPWPATDRLGKLPSRLGRDDGLIALRAPHWPRRPERVSLVLLGWITPG
jgi:hypothetical protein